MMIFLKILNIVFIEDGGYIKIPRYTNSLKEVTKIQYTSHKFNTPVMKGRGEVQKCGEAPGTSCAGVRGHSESFNKDKKF